MGVKLLAVATVIIGLTAYFWSHLTKDPVAPVYKEGWWGKTLPAGKVASDDVTIKPFTVKYVESDVIDVKDRLSRARLAEPLESIQFQYGFNTKYLDEVIQYWRTKYDWKKQVNELNKYSHYTTQIEGLSIHYVHVKPKLPSGSKLKVLPLMMIHGWPGSFVEFYKIIPLLTTPKQGVDYVFEVICPSIPGYGFSEAPKQPGFHVGHTARIFTKLMTRLKHEKFYVQGGDWGSVISSTMAVTHPERLIGAHFNMGPSTKMDLFAIAKTMLAAMFPNYFLEPGEKVIGLQDLLFIIRETGYLHLQASKPDTVGVALGDSPAGLAAYILEKFSTWTDPENVNDPKGALTKKFTLDELLTNVMIYWVTNSITSSMRYYRETLGADVRDEIQVPFDVPTGVAVFPNELLQMPRTVLKREVRNIVHYSIMERGGHFAAMEEPKLLADDIWKFASVLETKEKKKEA